LTSKARLPTDSLEWQSGELCAVNSGSEDSDAYDDSDADSSLDGNTNIDVPVDNAAATPAAAADDDDDNNVISMETGEHVPNSPETEPMSTTSTGRPARAKAFRDTYSVGKARKGTRKSAFRNTSEPAQSFQTYKVPQVAGPLAQGPALEWTRLSDDNTYHGQLAPEQLPLLESLKHILEETPGFGSRLSPQADYTAEDQASVIKDLCDMYDTRCQDQLSKDYRPIDM
jgi:hypothetical protein